MIKIILAIDTVYLSVYMQAYLYAGSYTFFKKAPVTSILAISSNTAGTIGMFRYTCRCFVVNWTIFPIGETKHITTSSMQSIGETAWANYYNSIVFNTLIFNTKPNPFWLFCCSVYFTFPPYFAVHMLLLKVTSSEQWPAAIRYIFAKELCDGNLIVYVLS